MRIVIIQGHPDRAGHFCHALAEAYAAGARDNGHEVRLVAAAELDLPFLRSQQEWEHGQALPAVGEVQHSLAWAEHWLVVTPVWLGDMPAMLKGFLEQVLRPGFAFTYPKAGLPKPKLGGRSARIVATVGMPAVIFRWWFGSGGISVLARNILGFVGLSPVRTTLIGTMGEMPPARASAWLARLAALGRRGD